MKNATREDRRGKKNEHRHVINKNSEEKATEKGGMEEVIEDDCKEERSRINVTLL